MRTNSGRRTFIVFAAVILSSLCRVTAQQEPQSGFQGRGLDDKRPNPAKATSTRTDASRETATPANSEPAGSPGQQNGAIQLTANIVNVVVTVTDANGKLVEGLGRDRFHVFDDNVKQQIAHFTDQDAPISLGVVYDVSGSMRQRLNRSLGAVRRFLDTSHVDDDFFLVTFNDRAKLVQDFTTSSELLVNRLMRVIPSGPTALYDAAYLAMEKVEQGRHQRKALLIISDGQDNYSRYSYEDVRNRVKETDVQIYAIGITDAMLDPLAGPGRAVLERITQMTGGRTIFVGDYDESDLVEACGQIAAELRHQYSIGYYPTDTNSQTKWHKVKIKIDPAPGSARLSLAYRDGYQSFNK